MESTSLKCPRWYNPQLKFDTRCTQPYLSTSIRVLFVLLAYLRGKPPGQISLRPNLNALLTSNHPMVRRH
jgi:hypothetical protein